MKPRLPLLLLILGLCSAAGCPKRSAPTLAPGTASTRTPDGIVQTFTQSADPASPATTTTKTLTREWEISPEVLSGAPILPTYPKEAEAKADPVRESNPSAALGVSRFRETSSETFTTIGAAQDNTATRSLWAKAWGKVEDAKAFFATVKWLPLLGLLPLGLLAASFTAWGQAMAISKEGRLMLALASLFLFIAPAVSVAIRDNATMLLVCTGSGLLLWYVWERKAAYKAAALGPGPLPIP